MKKTLLVIVLMFCSAVSIQYGADQGSSDLATGPSAAQFGKTHFIVGYPRQRTLESPACENELVTPNTDHEEYAVYFSPDDDIRQQLVQLIDGEQKHISIAMFMLTDGDITQALIRARSRGIQVEVVTDPLCLQDRTNKIGQLCNAGIRVHIYNPGYRDTNRRGQSLMHNKFVIFYQTPQNVSAVWTGSFNFTKSACDLNQENVIIISDQRIVNKYKKQFERLQQRSYTYGAKK